MTGKTASLHFSSRADAHDAGTGRKPGIFRSWLRKSRFQLATATLAFVLVGGAMALPQNGSSESVAVQLYKKGRLDMSKLTLDQKKEVWDYELVQGGPCGNNHQKVLAEIRAEQGRAMDSGDKDMMEKLIGLESLVSKGYRFLSADAYCVKGASK